jgi:hypothetical protein
MAAAVRWASAITLIIGFVPEAVGNALATEPDALVGWFGHSGKARSHAVVSVAANWMAWSRSAPVIEASHRSRGPLRGSWTLDSM